MKLKLLKNNWPIVKVLRHKGLVKVLDLTDDLAKSLNDKDLVILVYKYLADEIKSHRDSDVMKVMRLYESLNQIFPTPIVNASTRDTVETISRKFINLMKDMTEKKFTNGIFNVDRCRVHITSDVNYVLRAIIEYNRDMFKDLIDNVVLEIYGEKMDEILLAVNLLSLE